MISSGQEIKKDMKKESIANKPPEKPIDEVSNGSPLLFSETIVRTTRKGAARGLHTLPPPQALPLQLPLAGNHSQWELQGQHLRTGQRTETPDHTSAWEPEVGHAAVSGSCLKVVRYSIVVVLIHLVSAMLL
ncbi:SH3 domain-containing kinase-binding protein 1 [Chelonia mydas]|uniref:SH3 domain-containing kinase-binding protein 1 n=1 Tax=Chelonia mydas TaxID=8469 RepID=M7BBR8_CHEMY|nr:SH3 domain-containing kinase-binding protein 1 [Chelonia mydas]